MIWKVTKTNHFAVLKNPMKNAEKFCQEVVSGTVHMIAMLLSASLPGADINL